MNNIRILKDPNGEIFMSQADLLAIFKQRLSELPSEIELLKKPQTSSMVDANGIPLVVKSDPIEIARMEGMEKMLKGVCEMFEI